MVSLLRVTRCSGAAAKRPICPRAAIKVEHATRAPVPRVAGLTLRQPH
jgi:hypothetical protein